MFPRVAITPTAARCGLNGKAEQQALVQILWLIRRRGLLIGLENGPTVAEIVQELKNVPAPYGDLITQLAGQIQDVGRTVERKGSGAEAEASHLERLLAASGADPGAVIVAAQTECDGVTEAGAKALPIEEVLASPQWNELPYVVRVPRDPGGFERVLKSMLSTARKVLLVDPWIACRLAQGNDAYKDSLEVFDRCLLSEERLQNLSSVAIHTWIVRDEATKQEKETTWYFQLPALLREAMPRLGASSTQRELRIWRSKKNGPRMHNRRILTNHGGVMCAWGLDVAETEAVDEWTFIDDELSSELQDECEINTSPYASRWSAKW